MKLVVTQPVQIALRTLSAEDRRMVLACLDHLRNWENDAVVRERSHKLASGEGVYVLQTSTDIRIFYRHQQDEIVVLDIAKKATIVSSGHVPEHGHP